MHRSRFIALIAMGTATLALTACDDPTETSVFETVDQCIKSGAYSREECVDNFEKAKVEHAKAAPTFASRAECEAQFGPGKCEVPPSQPQPQQTAMGGGSFFMPMMLGYMMGSMSSGGRYVDPQPLYRTSQGGQAGAFRTASGEFVSNGVGRTSFDAKGPVTKTSTTTVARGGFGARAAATAGG